MGLQQKNKGQPVFVRPAHPACKNGPEFDGRARCSVVKARLPTPNVAKQPPPEVASEHCLCPAALCFGFGGESIASCSCSLQLGRDFQGHLRGGRVEAEALPNE